jgi:hypothetical protein
MHDPPHALFAFLLLLLLSLRGEGSRGAGGYVKSARYRLSTGFYVFRV